ncbi:hypothetical protein [Micromonospora sp. NPDC047074]|uniref:hypothetical protein n=1 Tax=Micromonospora sp. NPDC047074 TaxID=3154339 RepID=UPI0033D56560
MVQQPRRREVGPYSRSHMWMLAVTAGILGIVVLVWGVLRMTNGDSRGATMVAISTVIILILAVGIPYGRRRGRM